MTHWTYKGIEIDSIPDGAYGFIYRITSMVSGKRYIGRKYVTKSSRRSIKLKNGNKKIQKTRIESDWKTYTGSNKPLNEDIAKYGKENFKFEILAFANTKGQVNALEVICQIKADVMADPTYYNDAVGSGQFRGVKFDESFKATLRELNV